MNLRNSVLAFAAAFFVLFAGKVFAAETIVPMTPAEMAVKMQPSIGELRRGGVFTCTAWKMAPFQWATAKHCVSLAAKFKIYTDEGRTHEVKSVQTSLEKNAWPKDHWEDWAVLNTLTDSEDEPSLTIGCTDELYYGMPIGYMGHPGTMTIRKPITHLATGYVASLDKGLGKGAYHFMGTFESGPGSSGSPVISGDTGNVIGFLTRGIFNAQRMLMGVGLESVTAMDYCDESLRDVDESAGEDIGENTEEFAPVTITTPTGPVGGPGRRGMIR